MIIEIMIDLPIKTNFIIMIEIKTEIIEILIEMETNHLIEIIMVKDLETEIIIKIMEIDLIIEIIKEITNLEIILIEDQWMKKV